MSIKKISSLLLTFILGVGLTFSENIKTGSLNKDWLKIYYESDGFKRINAHPTSLIDSIYYSSVSIDSLTTELYLNVASVDSGLFSLSVDSINSIVLGTNIPTLYITTDPYVKEITSKVDYIQATLEYIPYGDGTDTIQGSVNIKGRGNTTWSYPKKPYRLKFEKKQPLGGLKKAKSFVLLANYLDNTIIKNAIAFKIAELIGLPYTNTAVPVHLFFNGEYRGSYVLTEKIGINSGSIDIDETKGILWELDTSFDEEYKFRDPIYELPLMVKDPDFNDLSQSEAEKEAMWEMWKNDVMEAISMVPKGKWTDAFDEDQLVKFFFVNTLVLNGELAHPKSTYMYKEAIGEKYKFGPVWDFDRSFGGNMEIDYPITSIWGGHFYARKFLEPIFSDERFKEKFRKVMDDFIETKLDALMEYIDSYAALVRDSALADALVWPEGHPEARNNERSTARFDENVQELKDWIPKRLELVKNSPTFLLY